MRDREALQSWYREAMVRRIDELVELRERLEEGAADAVSDLRKVAQALRGSGATFGFPSLTTTAAVVETTPDDQALLRCEGLLVELRRLTGDQRAEGAGVFEWLARCAAPGDARVAGSLDGVTTIEDAWTAVRRVAGIDDTTLTRRVAERLDLEVADLGSRSVTARRLVPEALTSSEGIVPLVEDSTTITVASANPVSLPTEVELRRLTGRRPRYAVAPPAALAAARAVGRAAKSALASDTPPAPDALGSDRPTARQPAPDLDASVSDAAKERRTAPAPDASGSDAPMEARPPTAPGEDGKAVLVVDDEPSARLLVRGLLEKRGFTAVEAGDGLEALEVLREHGEVGLAVVDLNMPRMDGLELMWELRDAARWSGLPVIVVTGEHDEVLETQIMEEGADDYIRKPLDPRLFLARVEATLRRASHRAGT